MVAVDGDALRDTGAEAAVIGACLMDEQAMAACASILTPADFSRPAHQEIWRVMLDMWRRGNPPDLVSVRDALDRQHALERIGGVSYLTGLVSSVATAAHAEHHAQIVARKARARRVLSAASRAMAAAKEEDLDTALQAAVDILTDSVDRAIVGVDLWQAAFETLERIQQRVISGESPAVPTGLAPLDRILDGGLWPSDLAIVAARPGTGKTALLLQTAMHVASSGGQVLFYSLEQAAAQLILRAVAAATGREASAIRRGYLAEEDWHRLYDEALARNSEGLHIVDQPMLTVDQMLSYAQVRRARYGLDLVLVDYLQIVGRSRPGRSREEEVAAISRGLKVLAKRLSVPVLAAAQLSRRSEERNQPQLSDLRESGAIEQDADVILFLWRAAKDPDDVVRLTVAKHRHGATGEIELVFDRPTQRFYAGGVGPDLPRLGSDVGTSLSTEPER